MHSGEYCDHNYCMRNLPGRTLTLIGILVVVALILVGLAIRNSKTKYTLPTAQVTPAPTIAKTASVEFSPSALAVTAATASLQTVDIVANTGENPASGVQVDITYDPKAITNVQLLAPNPNSSLFGTAGSYATLFKNLNPTAGTVFYAVAINPGGAQANGTGSVGQLQFSLVPGVKTAQISFGAKTLVTRAGILDSVLSKITPLIISVQ